MPIDAYSLCPGGTGKKIKFCCGDFLGELQKIERMVEGDQYVACLQHVDQLLRQRPDRACLLAIKGMMLRAVGNMEAAAANAEEFLQRHPGNATAIAESAIVTAAEKGGRAAMPLVQRAMAASPDGIQSRLYEALGTVAESLLADGQWRAGRSLLQLQMAIARDDDRPVQMLTELNRAAEVPLLLKDDPPMDPCPDNVPWKDQFQEAMAPLGLGHWQESADKLAALAAVVPDSPAVWRNLATIRAWLADAPGCAEALHRLAALEVPLEDAVEAEALAMLSSESPLDDAIDILAVTWTVGDVERVQTALLSDARAVPATLDPSSFASDDGPPPKAAYLLLDRAMPDTAENIAVAAIPNLLGQAMLFGRQTDREARLEVLGLTAADLPQVKAMLEQTAGDAIDPVGKEESVAKVSASQELLEHKWRLPRDASRLQVQTLTVEFQRNALLEKWPQLALGVLDGKSPREAAAEPGWRAKVLAAVMVLQSWNDGALGEADFNELRARLGLPTLDPIDPEQFPLETLPLVRLSRVMVEKLPDASLILGYRRAIAFSITAAMGKYARAVVDRPSLNGREEQLRAYGVLARTAKDPDQSLACAEEGRKAAEAAGQSSAPWDLLELSLRFGRGEGGEAMRLINHVQSQHISEPGVAEALTRMLVQIGLLRPDGTPNVPRHPQEAPLPDDQAAVDPGKLWTPESQQPAGKGKLWVPE